MSKLVSFLKDRSGVTAAEYGLILALVAGALIGGFTLLGGNIQAAVNAIAGKMN